MQLNLFELFSIIITFVAIIGYLNYRFIKIPTTTAIMVGSLCLSLVLILAGRYGYSSIEQQAYQTIASLDFERFLLQTILSFMLFAGGLNIHLEELWRVKTEIAVLATVSTICSALLTATAIYYVSAYLSIPLNYIHCLLFGALISPTDPIAVLALFKTLGVSKQLNVMVSGESLFNDGVGIVLFITFYELAFSSLTPNAHSVLSLFLKEVFGGIILGIILGVVGAYFIKSLENIKVEMLITLAIVMGGYSIANAIHASGPLAMVAAGISIGNDKSKKQASLYHFWEMIDEILNSILFFLVGIELVVLSHRSWSMTLSLISILIVLLSRFITVSIPMTIFKRRRRYPKKIIRILVWGGLRGGLAIALALSLPQSDAKGFILTMTYSVVIFSLVVQGLSIKPLIRAT
jgi:CPA1 family monovalent cation:H+ antiporter